jgi:hypothetical protein
MPQELGSSQTDNRFPDIAELSARVESLDQSSGEIVIKYNLVLGEGEISDELGNIWTVKLKSAHIKLHPSGATIDPTDKLGTQIKSPISASRKTVKGSESSTRLSAEGNLKISPSAIDISADFSAGASAQISEKQVEESTQERVAHRIVARGDNYWQVVAVEENTLSGTYLNDEKLCKVKQAPRANRTSVSAFVMARQRDFQIDMVEQGGYNTAIERLIYRREASKKRILDILLAKALNKQADLSPNYDPVLSRVSTS